MIDKRVGKRFKQAREKLGLTQEQFAEKTDFTVNYISRIERAISFPRYNKLIKLMNALETSADSIFCDVVLFSSKYKESEISNELSTLSPEARQRLLETFRLLINQEKENEKRLFDKR